MAVLCSLLLVAFTWHCSKMLADAAHVARRGTERFMVMSTLVAAAPPRGAMLTELMIWNGASIALLAGLVTLLTAFRMRQRQHENHRTYLIPPACILLASIIAALPACYWLFHATDTVLYDPQSTPPTSGSYPDALWFYSRTAVPQVLGTPSKQFPLCSFTLIIALISISIALASQSITRRWAQPFFVRFRRLTVLPLLFGSVVVLLYSCSSLLLIHPFSQSHIAAYASLFAEPLVLILPFLLAATFAIPYMITQHRNELTHEPWEIQPGSDEKSPPDIVIVHIGMLVTIGIYFCSQLMSYLLIFI
jgi:hypothetical protein